MYQDISPSVCIGASWTVLCQDSEDFASQRRWVLLRTAQSLDRQGAKEGVHCRHRGLHRAWGSRADDLAILRVQDCVSTTARPS